MNWTDYDTIECPDCDERIILQPNTKNIYCDNCGLDVYFEEPPRYNAEWNSLPWDTFRAGALHELEQTP